MFILIYNTINNFQNSWKIKLLKIQNFRKIKTIPNYSHAALYIYCQRNRMGAEMEVFLKAKTKQNSACPLGYAVPPNPVSSTNWNQAICYLMHAWLCLCSWGAVGCGRTRKPEATVTWVGSQHHGFSLYCVQKWWSSRKTLAGMSDLTLQVSHSGWRRNDTYMHIPFCMKYYRGPSRGRKSRPQVNSNM